ncbi:MAG: hypothetical protein IJQ16_10185 [Selenomonadaceae bacterium]|nr:hypothetical protein [Selenomonadaceae bacterium]
MKKIIFTLTIFVALIFSAATCAANDVWVDSWGSEGVDIYVMDDTIIGNNDRNYFSVSTKKVRNGKLIQVVQWKFSKFRGDMWRYETSTMDGSHTTVVIPRNKIFEFCINRLGWSYRIEGNYYY